MHSDKRFVTEMLRAGVAGYMTKDCAFEELTTAIRSIVANKAYLSPAIAGTVIEDYIQRLRDGNGSPLSLLSNREREVLQLIAEGKSTKETALRLHVSIKTIETHRRRIMEKLDLKSVAELTKYAVREGLTSLES